MKNSNMGKKVLVINGPNLNLLGTREKQVYGTETLQDMMGKVKIFADSAGISADFMQSNHEGGIIDAIQGAEGKYEAVIINPGAYTHYSLAIRDAVKAISCPVIEVHISNIHAREEFRSRSVIAPACRGQICGFGVNSYIAALQVVALW